METRTYALPGEAPDVSLDGPATLVLAFGPPDLDAADPVVQQVREAFPTSVVVGCSTSGQVRDSTIVDDDLVVVVARFGHTALRRAVTCVQGPADSHTAGRRLGAELAGEGLAGVLLLSDGIVVNGSDLVAGVAAELPAHVPVSGGLAGDHARFTRTWVLAGDRMGPGLVVAVGLYGDRLQLSHGCRHGWEQFGPARVVTRSEGGKLFALDGKPALALYKSYLGVYADELPGSALRFPLAVQTADRPSPVVRTILSVDEADQSMTFAGDLPEGATAQLMRATHDMLVDGAMDAAGQCIVGERPQGSALAFAVSCVGRRLVMGQRAEEELDAVRAVLGDIPLVGFYSNGEVSPGDGFSELHNQTMTLALLVER